MWEARGKKRCTKSIAKKSYERFLGVYQVGVLAKNSVANDQRMAATEKEKKKSAKPLKFLIEVVSFFVFL